MSPKHAFIVAAAFCLAIDHAAARDSALTNASITLGGYNDTKHETWVGEATLTASDSLQEAGPRVILSGRDVGPYSVDTQASLSIHAGVIKMAGSATFTGSVHASASASLHFYDSFTLHGTPAQADSVVLVHYSMLVDGSTDLSFVRKDLDPDAAYGLGLSYVEWGLLHSVSPGSGTYTTSLRHRSDIDPTGKLTISNSVNNVDGNPYGLHTFVVRAYVNRPVDVHTSLVGKTRLSNQTYHSAEVAGSFDLGNSVYWGGISKITTLDGTPLDLTVTSASGMDYLKSYIPPVPEPSAWALLIAGLAVLPLARRKLH